MTITASEVRYQAFCLVLKVALVLLAGALLDELFLQRTFTPSHWGAPLAYLVLKASHVTRRDKTTTTLEGVSRNTCAI
jgi:hypothetical protein